MSSSSIGAWPHHSDSRWPRISASSARRNAYSTSGVSEISIDATAIPCLLRLILSSLRSRHLEGCFEASWFETALRPLPRGSTSHVPDFLGHVVEGRMPVDLGLRRLEHHALLGGIGRGDRA